MSKFLESSVLKYVIMFNQIAIIVFLGVISVVLHNHSLALAEIDRIFREANHAVEMVVHDVYFDPETYEMSQIRTASVYPLRVFWEGNIVDVSTEEILCRGSGFGDVEERHPTHTVGPMSIDTWVGYQGCMDLIGGHIIAAVGKWTWTDAQGDPAFTTFRSNPISIPEAFPLVESPTE